MTFSKLALCVSLMMAASCGVAAPDEAAPSEPDEAATTSELQVPALELAATACKTAGGTCLSAFNCHHQEGVNLNKSGCATGLICCGF